MMDEPFSEPKARTLIRKIVAMGGIAFSRHAREEMGKDDLDEVDVTNVLRGGVVEPGEFENGSWRYRVRARRIYVVIAFRSEEGLVVVTAWRER